MRRHSSVKKGFTLIELLIVIAIIGILAAIILVAVDPAKRLAQSRDARRSGEVYSILNAILNYTVDNKGHLPAGIAATSVPQVLGTATTGCNVSCTGSATTSAPAVACANLASDLVDKYIADIPVDPSGGSWDATKTGYYLTVSGSNRVEVGACAPEQTSAIKVKR